MRLLRLDRQRRQIATASRVVARNELEASVEASGLVLPRPAQATERGMRPEAAPSGGGAALNLIHTSKVPNPRQCSLSGRLAVSVWTDVALAQSVRIELEEWLAEVAVVALEQDGRAADVRST